MTHSFVLARIARNAVNVALMPTSHPMAERDVREMLYAVTPDQIAAILDAVDGVVYDTVHGFTFVTPPQCCTEHCTGRCDGKGVEGLCDDHLEAVGQSLESGDVHAYDRIIKVAG